MEAFAKFGSDLDAATKNVIDKGARNVEVLKQGQYSPLRVEQQIAIIYLGTKGLLRDVDVRKVRDFETNYLSVLEATQKPILDRLKKGEYDDSITSVLEKVAKDLTAKYA